MKIPGLSLDAEHELPWKKTRVPGIAWWPLQVGPGSEAETRGPRDPGGKRAGGAVLIRMEPGCGYRAHRHLGTEDVLVLAGGYRDERGSYGPGSYVHYEAGSAHAPVALGDSARPVDATNPACVLFAVAPGGIELLPEDSVPNAGSPPDAPGDVPQG